MNLHKAQDTWSHYLTQRIQEVCRIESCLIYDPHGMGDILAPAHLGFQWIKANSPLHLRLVYEQFMREGPSSPSIYGFFYKFSDAEIPYDIGRAYPTLNLSFQSLLEDLLQQGKSESLRPVLEAVGVFWQAFIEQFHLCHLTLDSPISTAFRETLKADTKALQVLSNLFSQGLIQPAAISDIDGMPAGLIEQVHFVVDAGLRIERATENVNSVDAIPSPKRSDWLEIAWQLSAIYAEAHRCLEQSHPVFATLRRNQEHISAKFEQWFLETYSSHLQSPFLPRPATVSKVLPYLEYCRQKTSSKRVALIVMDGMSLSDWITIRETWKADTISWNYEEMALFALLPSLTSISRQGLMSGKIPRQFAESWLTTNQESRHWTSFWQEKGLSPDQIGYVRGISIQANQADLREKLASVLENPHLGVVGIIINVIDDLMHHNLVGEHDLQRQIRDWAEKSVLKDLITTLLTQFELVFLASDHGHVEGSGIGKPEIQTVATESSQRTIIFPTSLQGNLSAHENILWTHSSLPEGYQACFPQNFGLYAPTTEKRTSHGSPSLPEIMVPFIQITR